MAPGGQLAATVALDGYRVVAITTGHTSALAQHGLWTTTTHPEARRRGAAAAGGRPTPPPARSRRSPTSGGSRRATGAPDSWPGALAFRAIEPHTATARLRLAARLHEQGDFAALPAV